MSGAGRGRKVASSPAAAIAAPRPMTTHFATLRSARSGASVSGATGRVCRHDGRRAARERADRPREDEAPMTPSGEDGLRLRLMAVHAHPDDESSKGAATMARYAREGADVVVVTCTGGERGDILNPAMDRPEVRAELTAVR